MGGFEATRALLAWALAYRTSSYEMVLENASHAQRRVMRVSVYVCAFACVCVCCYSVSQNAEKESHSPFIFRWVQKKSWKGGHFLSTWDHFREFAE